MRRRGGDLKFLFVVAWLGIDAVDVNTEYGVVQGQMIPVDKGIDSD